MQKKQLLYTLFLALVLNHTKITAQDRTDFANDICVKKDNFILDGFYGWPYFNGAILKSLGSSNGITNVKNINHIGGKIEYIINDNLGVGGEFTYADAGVNYISASNGLWQKAGVSKIRILGRLNYHFSTTKNFDPYFAFGAGYKKTTFYDTGRSGYNENFNILPISIKIGIGMRAYFNDTFGFMGEIGIGGPLISAGLCVKI